MVVHKTGGNIRFFLAERDARDAVRVWMENRKKLNVLTSSC